MDMTKLMAVARRFHKDEDGAAMVEYSILIGIIAAASIATIAAIGLWVSGQFTGLCSKMDGHGVGTGSTGLGTCS
jgi:pilus assembly protein Flp/PilA